MVVDHLREEEFNIKILLIEDLILNSTDFIGGTKHDTKFNG